MGKLNAFYIDKEGQIISEESFLDVNVTDVGENASEHTRIAKCIIDKDEDLKKDFEKTRWREEKRYDLFLIEKGYVAVGCFEIEGGVVLYNSSLISDKQKEKIEEYNKNKYMLADYVESNTLSNLDESEEEPKNLEAESDGR